MAYLSYMAVDTYLSTPDQHLTTKAIPEEVVILNRVDGSVSFQRMWDDYKSGFGNKEKNFWLGLDKVHQITNARPYSLNVDFRPNLRQSLRSSYMNFSVGPESDGYRLKVCCHDKRDHYRFYNGGDSLTASDNMKFTTCDVDNDEWSGGNCACSVQNAGWWFSNCGCALPTGIYRENGIISPNGLYWCAAETRYRDMYYSYIKMKFTLIPAELTRDQFSNDWSRK